MNAMISLQNVPVNHQQVQLLCQVWFILTSQFKLAIQNAEWTRGKEWHQLSTKDEMPPRQSKLI